jgi:hypothetical protein
MAYGARVRWQRPVATIARVSNYFCDRFSEPGAVHQEGKAVEWRGTAEIVGARAQLAAPSGAAMEAS